MAQYIINNIINNTLKLVAWLATTSAALRGRSTAIAAAARILDAQADCFIAKRDTYALLDALVGCGEHYPYLLCRELWSKFGLTETAFSQMYLDRCTAETAARISADEALESVIENGWCYDTGGRRLDNARQMADGTWYDVAVYYTVYGMNVPWAEKDSLVVAAVNAANAAEVPEVLRDLYEQSAPYDCSIQEALVDLVVTDDDLIEVSDEELEDLFGF